MFSNVFVSGFCDNISKGVDKDNVFYMNENCSYNIWDLVKFVELRVDLICRWIIVLYLLSFMIWLS